MVFPRNAGFGRCYLVSTRHEIPYNIDRNLTGTRLRLRKNRNKINPESANPIPVLLLSFESQTVVFSLSLSHPLPPPLFPQPPRFLGVELNSLPTYRRALLSERLEQANPNPDLTLTLIAVFKNIPGTSSDRYK